MSVLKEPDKIDSDLIHSDLDKLRKQGLFRAPRIIAARNSVNIIIDGKELVNFSSNDYLGFANHSRIREAINDASIQHGVGSGASPLICGKTALHQELEDKLAAATGRDRSLLFSCGYMANLGIVQGLTRTIGSHVIMDKLCHASIIDGVMLSGASFSRYKHTSAESLLSRLKAAGSKRKLVLTESVFSMDGDLAPLDQISRLCLENGACLVVDDAHGFGVLGENGMGGLEHFGLTQAEAPIMMATFGKALGVQGAFVAGREDMIEALVQRARPYIYSTSMPVSDVAGVIEALNLLRDESSRRDHLKNLVTYYHQGLIQQGREITQNLAPIQPLIIGSADKTIEISRRLEQQGVFVTAIRPPTVPKRTSRLRITLTAAHTKDQVLKLLDAIKFSLQKSGISPTATGG